SSDLGGHLVQDLLRRFGGDGNQGDVDVLATRHALEVFEIVDWHAAPRLLADLGVGDVEHRDNLKALTLESGVIGKRLAEIARAHHADAQLPIEAENLAQVAAEILNVVADATNAKLTEIRQILSNLGGVEMESFRQRLRRNGFGAGSLELIQAAQVNRQSIRREL